MILNTVFLSLFLKVDVIVNTVDASLNLKRGAVSKAIFEAATNSQALQDELMVKKGSKKYVDYAELFETDSYGINCQRIYHGTLRPWTADTDVSKKVNLIMLYFTLLIRK